jgi:hypothetical protein
MDASIGFNPHPASLPGDAITASAGSTIALFQSAPGIAAG